MSDLKVPVLFLKYFTDIGPGWLRRLGIKLTPSRRVQRIVNIVDIMEKTSVDIVKERRQAVRLGEDNVVKQIGLGKDIMSILCKTSQFSLFNIYAI